MSEKKLDELRLYELEFSYKRRRGDELSLSELQIDSIQSFPELEYLPTIHEFENTEILPQTKSNPEMDLHIFDLSIADGCLHSLLHHEKFGNSQTQIS
ncbi:hypothetical protein LOD99_6211 [Oopsacas minuta]|uniref:Uncharacterized protein n=1 Tax=Oopsacas minuta TaxID=111878 RepID=A0AAV7JMU3_9METZ|nr:hypothetical protein LOD99_6211 [Oopsacas minuta]